MLGPVTAADLDPTGDLKTQARKFVKVEKPAVLNGVKRVVIASHMVDYVTELRYTKSLSGFEAMIGADSDVSIKLVGGDNAQFQAITDKFYAQTVEELAAQGIQVMNTTSDTTAVTDTAKNAALVALNVAAVAARFGDLNVGGIGGFSATKEYELHVQPERFEQTLANPPARGRQDVRRKDPQPGPGMSMGGQAGPLLIVACR